MSRLLIRLSFLIWLSLVMFLVSVYVTHRSTSTTLSIQKYKRPIYVFTRIFKVQFPSSKFHQDCKMIRRQYKRLADQNGSSFTEYFLDPNGLNVNYEWAEKAFHDILYGDNPLESMLEMISGVRSTMPNNGIFVYMNNFCFDLVQTTQLQAVSANDIGLYCLTGMTKGHCNDDFFAFNYKTAQIMRRKLLNMKFKTTDTYFKLLVEAMNTTKSWEDKPCEPSSIVSDFFKFSSSTKPSKSNEIGPVVSLKLDNLIRYSNLSDASARFNPKSKIQALQPLYVADEEQEKIKYLTRPKSCNTGELTVFVKCARFDEFERNWARNYTTEMAKIGKFDFDLIFLLGNGDDLYIDVLQKEASKYGDLLIGDFIDSYDNLPIKTYLGYQFYAEECTNKKYVVFQDSDAFTLLDVLMEDFQLDKGLLSILEKKSIKIIQKKTETPDHG